MEPFEELVVWLGGAVCGIYCMIRVVASSCPSSARRWFLGAVVLGLISLLGFALFLSWDMNRIMTQPFKSSFDGMCVEGESVPPWNATIPTFLGFVGVICGWCGLRSNYRMNASGFAFLLGIVFLIAGLLVLLPWSVS